MLGTLSITQPTRSTSTLIISRIKIGLLVMPEIKETSFVGTWARVTYRAKPVAKASRNITSPFMDMASIRVSQIALRSSSLYTNTPMMMEYTTATTAASVGVKKPE